MVDFRNDWMMSHPMFGKLFEVNFGMPPMPPMPQGHRHPHHPFPHEEHPHPHPHHHGCEGCHHVKVNVIEKADSYVVEMCVPGRSKEDLSLYVNDGVLYVESVQKTQEATQEGAQNEPQKESLNYLSREFFCEPFEEAFELPDNADLENVSAKTENGILTITVAKKAKSGERKQIEIK